MANPVEFANYATTTLTNAITSVQTTITVDNVAAFAPANLGVGHYFYLTLIDAASYHAGTSPPAQREVVKVTLITGSVLTVLRGQDDTVAQAFAACDIADLRFNAQAARDLRDTGGGGSALEVQDEGIAVDLATTVLNFTGAGVTATDTSPGIVQVAIPGGGGSAPNISYATVNDESGTFSHARQLVAGANITLTDGGAGTTLTIAAAGGGGGTLQALVFSSSGTWTHPAGVTAAWANVYAGGGAGSGGTVATNGSGGGAGEFCEGFPFDLVGASTAIVVGAGGAAGAAGADGSPGGNSSVGPFVALGGGKGTVGTGGSGGGVRGAAGTVGAGAVGTAETPSFYGGSGGGGGGTGSGGTPGGGSAGRLLGGAAGTTASGGGGGAATPLGVGGAGGTASAAGVAAAANTGAGGGGGGGGANTVGGAGGSGKVVVFWIG